jgi:hypothetical protein
MVLLNCIKSGPIGGHFGASVEPILIEEPVNLEQLNAQFDLALIHVKKFEAFVKQKGVIYGSGLANFI